MRPNWAGIQNRVPAVMLLLALCGIALAQQDGGTVAVFLRFEDTEKALSREQQRNLEMLRIEPTAMNVRVVRLNLSALYASAVQINLQESEALIASRTSQKSPGKSTYTWIGELAGRSGRVVLVVRGDRVTGNIHDGSSLYQIRPIGGGLHAVVAVNERLFPPPHPPDFKAVERWDSGRHFDLHGATLVEPQQLDVLVAYTPDVDAHVPDVDGLIALAIEENNLANQNSQVNVVVNLVRSYPTQYTESGDFYTDLTRFRTPGDGYMDEVHAQRDQSGADVAVLIMNNPAYCGLASALMASQLTAFAAVHYSCATGNLTFAHELGHLQGARHNPEQDPESRPFPYGHGYQDPEGEFRTVMSYSDGCRFPCPRVPYWSSSSVELQGQPTGTRELHDNARVLNETATFVAGFRDRQPDISVSGLTFATGGYVYQAENSLTASAISVSQDARVTFVAGNYIKLLPEFRATAGSQPVTFQARLQ